MQRLNGLLRPGLPAPAYHFLTLLQATLVLFIAFALSARAQPQEFLLGSGDVIKITVFQNPDLTTEARVSENGTIIFPLIGTVKVGDQSVSQVEQIIAHRLRTGDLVKRPDVNAMIISYRSLQVSVLGQVNKPGKFSFEQSQNRLTDVLALAGGVTPLGADVITLITSEGEKEKKIDIDLPAMIQSGDRSKDVVLKNGDIVFVPRHPVFYIYGEVQRPGQYRIERDLTVMQAVTVGGGLTNRATEKGIRVNRRGHNGKVVTRVADPLEPVAADDVIYVRESLF
jgi:polysaccharide export outer membrane protein